MKLFDALFRCLHKRTTFPMSSKRGQHRSPAERSGVYVVCLDCGKEFAYDWNKMRIQQREKHA
jgi:RNase P subunit RPR2